uniref:Uncharacterized protein n=1 Tax=Chaetoceros debilis TaxID=122233 RepID=A0A7S3PVI0_9STRA|mmetsp:Transcript_30334/g.46431  ORF Transcript_30334/g.46431 Transcript_30334/m.46431 type:complete len:796 (+) Transcript_30334:33-2420(+)
MQSKAHFSHVAERRDASFPTRDSTIAITVTDETVQQSINQVNQQGTGRTTYQRHQRSAELFIEYIEQQHANGAFQIEGGNISNLIVPLDFSVPGRDKEDFVAGKRPKRYRLKDIVWHNLPVSLVKAYLSTEKMRFKHTRKGVMKKTTDNRPIYNCRDYPSKFVSALKFCNKMVGGEFSHKFLFDTGQHVEVSKRGYTTAKKQGQTEENVADPIPFSLLFVICKHAVTYGLVLLWAMSLLQWNCIGRVKNIGELQFCNFTLPEDSIGITYDDTKTKKNGEDLNVKHVYANVKTWFMNCLCALGIYLMHVNSSWVTGQTLIFANFSTKSESAASKYGSAMKSFVKKNMQLVRTFMNPANFNPYGLRKGPATHASSNTTSPPPIPSIFHCGEWSMGTVIDIYWRYAEAGDHYLGRLLAGYSPNEKDFDTLPPHFTVGLDHPTIDKAMTICFGNILFMALPLFQDPTLLAKVKKFVTIKKTEGICATPTGIPPHAQMFKSLEEIMSKIDIMDNNFQTIINDRKQLLEDYTTKINDLLEKRALENNQLTHQNLKELLGEATSDIKKDIKENILGEIRNEIKEALQRCNIANNDTGNELTLRTLLPSPSANQESLTINIYTHGSGQKYYFTPYKNYGLPPKCKLQLALGFILNGDRACRTEQQNGELALTPVRPFCLWESHEYLPPKLWKKFKVGWKPMLDVLMGLPLFRTAVRQIRETALQQGPMPKIYSSTELQGMKEACISYLINTKASYIQKKNYSIWTITTWSSNIQYCKIADKGTSTDIQKLPPPSARNKRKRRE